VSEVPNGGVLRFRSFFNIERLIPTSPEALRAVLSDHSYDYEKPSPVRDFLMRVLGRGLILVEGNEHKFQRKHLLPAFQIQQIRDLYPVFWEKSRGLVEGIEAEVLEGGPDTVVEFGDWATRVTLDIIGVAGMGRDFKALRNPDDELVKNYNELLEPSTEKGVFFIVNLLLPMWLVKRIPWKVNDSMTRISNELRQYALNLVRERQTELAAKRGMDERDILTLLVKSNDFKDTELAEQLLTFLAAGYAHPCNVRVPKLTPSDTRPLLLRSRGRCT
jgi:cytochrome P450